jgi:hypothetical protein
MKVRDLSDTRAANFHLELLLIDTFLIQAPIQRLLSHLGPANSTSRPRDPTMYVHENFSANRG